VGIGTQSDGGVLAFKAARKEVKRLQKGIKKAIKDSLPNAVQEEAQESPAEIEFAYTMDIVRTPTMSASKIMRQLGAQSFPRDFSAAMEEVLPVQVAVRNPPHVLEVRRVRICLQWQGKEITSVTDVGTLSGSLDCCCLAYSESRLVRFSSYRGETQQVLHSDSGTAAARSLCAGMARAMWQGEHRSDERGGLQHVELDLEAIPLQVTDIFFALSSYGADNLEAFPRLTARIFEASSGRQLTEFVVTPPGDSRVVLMCSLSPIAGRQSWTVSTWGLPTSGSTRNSEPLKRTIAEIQSDYERWNRREHLIKLRVLHKLRWITRHSSSQLAHLLWRILELPVPVFQILCIFF